MLVKGVKMMNNDYLEGQPHNRVSSLAENFSTTHNMLQCSLRSASRRNSLRPRSWTSWETPSEQKLPTTSRQKSRREKVTVQTTLFPQVLARCPHSQPKQTVPLWRMVVAIAMVQAVMYQTAIVHMLNLLSKQQLHDGDGVYVATMNSGNSY